MNKKHALYDLSFFLWTPSQPAPNTPKTNIQLCDFFSLIFHIHIHIYIYIHKQSLDSKPSFPGSCVSQTFSTRDEDLKVSQGSYLQVIWTTRDLFQPRFTSNKYVLAITFLPKSTMAHPGLPLCFLIYIDKFSI